MSGKRPSPNAASDAKYALSSTFLPSRHYPCIHGGFQEKIFFTLPFSPASFLSLRFGHWVDCGILSWKGPPTQPSTAISPPASISCPISGRGGGSLSQSAPPIHQASGQKKRREKRISTRELVGSPFERGESPLARQNRGPNSECT